MILSLCINTFNEEKNIHIPLDSAYDFVDEVIIVDGSSKDKTVEIAKSYGAKVKIFIVDNPRNFLTNKQRAIEKASGEWILQLDADEAISKELKEEIKSTINESRFSGYNIPRKNWFLTRFLMKGGVYPDYVLRLYKKENARFDLKDLHENVKIINNLESRIQNLESKKEKILNSKFNSEFSTLNSELKIGYLKNPILHYADPNFSRYLIRWDHYTTFDAETLHQKIKDQRSKIFLCFLIIFLSNHLFGLIKLIFVTKDLWTASPDLYLVSFHQ